jgi:hypothetical protein
MFLRNLIESLLKRLQAIIDGLGNHAKYPQRSCTHNGTFSGPKSINKGEFILNIHEGSFYLACTV